MCVFVSATTPPPTSCLNSRLSLSTTPPQLATMAASSANVVLYSTSVPTLPKVRADIATIKRILEAKKVEYQEVRQVDAVGSWCV